jgi:hypothetical protein
MTPDLLAVADMDHETLLTLAERLAAERHDGHLTLLRFTTGWKACLGTPDLEGGGGGDQVRRLRAFPTIKEALVALILGTR